MSCPESWVRQLAANLPGSLSPGGEQRLELPSYPTPVGRTGWETWNRPQLLASAAFCFFYFGFPLLILFFTQTELTQSTSPIRPNSSFNCSTMATEQSIPRRERRPSVGAPLVDIQGAVGPAGISRPKHKRTFTGFGAGDIKSVEGKLLDCML